MNTLNEQIEKFGLSKVDMGQITLNAAEAQIQDHEENWFRHNAFAFYILLKPI